MVALVATGCGADGSDSAPTETTEAPEETPVASSADFGELTAPCGPDVDGTTVSVEESEAGLGTDKLYLGVANERSTSFRAGLLKELYDAGVAFTEWCNEQGGIGGLEIGLVDLDGKTLEVEAAMTTACTDVFAMVGGGFVQDNLMFSGKPESDFHECDMISFPGFSVSTEFAGANGTVQANPNTAYKRPAAFLEQLVDVYGEKMATTTIVFGNLPSIVNTKDQLVAVGERVDGFEFTNEVVYDSIAVSDWGLIAQQAIANDTEAIAFVGEPTGLAEFAKKLREQDWEGPVFGEANHYDQLLIDSAGADAVENVVVRSGFMLYEEAEEGSATAKVVEVLEDYGPDDAKLAALTSQAFSAWLLFVTAANDCAASNDGVLTRDCVMAAGLDVDEWTAGGMQPPSDPGDVNPAECMMLVTVDDGEFVRLFPELGSDDDDGNGFNCGELGILDVEGDFGEGVVDESRDY